MQPDFNTITGRCLGLTPQQWDARRKAAGITDEQLYDILLAEHTGRAHDQQSRRFFRSGKLGTPEQYLTSNPPNA